jgi:hypothetical protein
MANAIENIVNELLENWKNNPYDDDEQEEDFWTGLEDGDDALVDGYNLSANEIQLVFTILRNRLSNEHTEWRNKHPKNEVQCLNCKGKMLIGERRTYYIPCGWICKGCMQTHEVCGKCFPKEE